MKFALKVILPAVLLALLTAGCYTRFYRPGMERAGMGPYDQIYNRYDSSAIDTTLTQKDYEPPDEYPYYNDWYYWGRPRTRTLWGFDFNNFSPDYYWSYYGYYDYYGTPWWRSWYDPWYWWYPYGGGNGVPVEPPSRRPGERSRGDGGNYQAPPPSAAGGGTYGTPSNPPPSSPPPNDNAAKQGTPPASKQTPAPPPSDPNKHGGGRGR